MAGRRPWMKHGETSSGSLFSRPMAGSCGGFWSWYPPFGGRASYPTALADPCREELGPRLCRPARRWCRARAKEHEQQHTNTSIVLRRSGRADLIRATCSLRVGREENRIGRLRVNAQAERLQRSP